MIFVVVLLGLPALVLSACAFIWAVGDSKREAAQTKLDESLQAQINTNGHNVVAMYEQLQEVQRLLANAIEMVESPELFTHLGHRVPAARATAPIPPDNRAALHHISQRLELVDQELQEHKHWAPGGKAEIPKRVEAFPVDPYFAPGPHESLNPWQED